MVGKICGPRFYRPYRPADRDPIHLISCSHHTIVKRV